DVAPAVVPPVLLQLEALAGARDELPQARGVRARIGHRIERALHHRQQRQLGGHAALLQLIDDMEEVHPAAVEDALQVLGARRVIRGLFAHQRIVDVGHAEALADALPEVLWRCRAVDQGNRRARPDRGARAFERLFRRRSRCDHARRRWRQRAAAFGRGGRRSGLGLRRLLRRRRGAAVEHGDCGESQELFERQNRFFQSRIAANTLTGSATRAPRYLFADSTTAGSRQRKNGLVAFSSASVLGNVGLPASRSLRSRASRAVSASLSGSTAFAKPMLASVYSWPQYTLVSSGSAASLASEANICSAVPSNRRPQPQAKSVSPQKSAPAP